MYFKEGIFKNFTNFSRKHLHWEITYNFMKKRAPFWQNVSTGYFWKEGEKVGEKKNLNDIWDEVL